MGSSLVAKQVKDLVLSLLWVTAMVQVHFLAWELLHALGMAKKKKNRYMGLKATCDRLILNI